MMGKIGHPSAIAPLKALRERKRRHGRNSDSPLAGDARRPQRDHFARRLRPEQRLRRRAPAGHRGAGRPPRPQRHLHAPGHDRPCRTAALRAAGRRGGPGQGRAYDPRAYEFCVRIRRSHRRPAAACAGAYVKPEEASKAEQMAVLALGHLGNVAAVDVLLPVLKSPDGPARVAAAKSILMLLVVQQARNAQRPRPLCPRNPSPPIRRSSLRCPSRRLRLRPPSQRRRLSNPRRRPRSRRRVVKPLPATRPRRPW